jgi:hypothetical protein
VYFKVHILIVDIRIICKVPQRLGFDPTLGKLSIKSSKGRELLELILKLGKPFETSSWHLKNFVRLLGSKIVQVHRSHYPNSPIGLCKA